ncbi:MULTISPECIES: cyclic pyranopterin monophosphate synthase MoaC [Idiomarina]|uniref:cyclic pyranopterin monophosphate synthase MoaC n=1 Tax=Idiomarina TaxID=135575 RepID=UPI000C3604CE|nr:MULTISPECIES: cyclic pyranopterin monophosphate synthase MoaC [Idiomarina]MBP59495.1 cyclic pyranopterin monophosphate synthase MoaC [Idiomarina sp.]|tara:strand:+ start:41 stop:529 length:489 start_codon:yes stop_codon:yes gene_type:complete
MSELTHLNQHGEAHMVDVADKATTTRIAVAQSRLRSRTDVIELLEAAAAKKGDVLATARIAGIMSAKKCSELIPLCHPLALTKVTIDFELDHEKGEVRIQSLCKVTGSTGVEMEALTAASVAALTVYDMCKAVDPAMVITDTCLLEKEGGKRGHWTRGGTPL